MNAYEYDLYKEMYYHEINQKEAINNRLSIPVGVLSLLIGVAYFFISNESNILLNAGGVVFFVLLSLLIVAICLVVYFCVRAYYGYDYDYIAMPKDIHKYSLECDEIYKNHDNHDGIVCQKIRLFLIEQYIDATQTNRNSNFKKIDYLRLASFMLIVSIVLCALCIIPFSMSFQEPMHVVKVVQQ